MDIPGTIFICIFILVMVAACWDHAKGNTTEFAECLSVQLVMTIVLPIVVVGFILIAENFGFGNALGTLIGLVSLPAFVIQTKRHYFS